MADLLRPFAHHLPNLRMYASDHDKGNIIVGQDQLDRALELVSEDLCVYVCLTNFLSLIILDFGVKELKHFENLNRNSHSKLKTACNPDSNAVLDRPPDSNSSGSKDRLLYSH